MGSRAVRDLAEDPEVGRLTIADANLDAAERLAAELGGDRVEARRIDAADRASLLAALDGHDAAGGAIGPFYLHEAPILRAAVDAGVPYASICDDYDAAEAALALDSEARAAGVPAVTGAGWTPGLSNMLTRHAAERFDEVEEVEIAWAASAADSNGFAVILHTIHIFTGEVPSWRDGRPAYVEAGSGRRRVRFPSPLGEVDVFDLGHPEPVTLPRSIPGLKTVTLKGGLTEMPLNLLARALARLGLTDTPQKKRRLGKAIKIAMPLLTRLGGAGEPCSGIRVDVTGRSGETRRRGTIGYGAVGHMDALTGVPLALAVRMLARGEIVEPGVHPPEAVIPAVPFLAALRSRGVRIMEMGVDRTLELSDPATAAVPAIKT